MVSQIKSWSQCNLSDGIRDVRGWEFPLDTIQYNTIQILLSTPHGGFSETNINSTGNKKNKQTKNTQELSINNFPENRPPKYLSPCLQGGRVTLMLGLP